MQKIFIYTRSENELNEVLALLDSLKIEYKLLEHEAVYTVEHAKFTAEALGGVGCANLFLKSKKGYFLLITEGGRRADLKTVGKETGAGHLSFGNAEELKSILGLISGAVSPFGIINDTENKVKLMIDGGLKGKKLVFHPNVNTASVLISFDDLIKFTEYEKHEIRLLEEGILYGN